MSIAHVLRQHQEAHDLLGTFYKAMHTFSDRTVERFFDDTPDLPHPVLEFAPVTASCKGEYQVRDGMALEHRITIDLTKCATAEDAAEVLAHELVHLWQAHLERLPERNYHSSDFHNRLGLMGILSSGKRGHHVGYVEGDVWREWLEENADLELPKFIMPKDESEKRHLRKFMCPECGDSFRTRKLIRALCLECDVEFEEQ